MTIQNIVLQRQIQFLMHFTRMSNVSSILQYGLLTRGQVAFGGIEAAFNDDYRLDQTDSTCLTISFPNYKTFRPMRAKYPEPWAVLALRPSILWEKDCAFCVENAASNNVTAIPIEQRRGHEAMAKMFAPYGDKNHDLLKIPPHCTTNPQAEVLVFDPIEPKYVVGVALQSEAHKQHFLTNGPAGFDYRHMPQLFGPRLDYLHWKKVQ